MQVIVWVLGEYGSLADVGASGVLIALGNLAERRPPSEFVRGYLISAIAKLSTQVDPFSSCKIHICSRDFPNFPHVKKHLVINQRIVLSTERNRYHIIYLVLGR